MPFYRTRITNSEFSSSDEGKEYRSLEQATEAGIATASDIARDLLLQGTNPSTIEIILEEDARVVARHVLTLTAAPLQIG